MIRSIRCRASLNSRRPISSRAVVAWSSWKLETFCWWNFSCKKNVENSSLISLRLSGGPISFIIIVVSGKNSLVGFHMPRVDFGRSSRDPQSVIALTWPEVCVEKQIKFKNSDHLQIILNLKKIIKIPSTLYESCERLNITLFTT